MPVLRRGRFFHAVCYPGRGIDQERNVTAELGGSRNLKSEFTMKLRFTNLAAATLVLFACVLVARPFANHPQDHQSRSSCSSVSISESADARIVKKSKAAARSEKSARKQPAAELTRRFDEILVSKSDADQKLAAITGTAGAWLQERIDLLEGLKPVDRYRKLSGIESEARELVLAEFERMGIEEELRVKLLAGALEPVHAEIQYASAAPDPASRLAMLRLDRERLLRLQQARTSTDENQKFAQLAELNSWYQNGLEAILGNPTQSDPASDLP